MTHLHHSMKRSAHQTLQSLLKTDLLQLKQEFVKMYLDGQKYAEKYLNFN